jgi:hypothetical protein
VVEAETLGRVVKLTVEDNVLALKAVRIFLLCSGHE